MIEAVVSIYYPHNSKKRIAVIARVLRIIAGVVLIIVAIGGIECH